MNLFDSMRHLYEMRDEFSSTVKISQMLYSQCLHEYDSYIENVAKFMNEIKQTDNVIYYSVLLKLLTDSGIFTDGNILYYQQDTDDNISGFWGVNVINGCVCCRHLAKFQYDVFSKAMMGNRLFFCVFSHDKLTRKEIRNSEDKHVVNLILSNDTLYGYDATRNMLFSFVDECVMKQLHSNNPSYLYYMDYLDVIFNNVNEKITNSLMNVFAKNIGKKTISENEYKLLSYMAKDTINANKSVIADFKNESKKRTRRIVDEII